MYRCRTELKRVVRRQPSSLPVPGVCGSAWLCDILDAYKYVEVQGAQEERQEADHRHQAVCLTVESSLCNMPPLTTHTEMLAPWAHYALRRFSRRMLTHLRQASAPALSRV